MCGSIGWRLPYDDSSTDRIISYVCVYMFNVSIYKHSEMRTKCSFCVGDTMFGLFSPCDLSRATTKSIVECSTIFICVAATKCRTRLSVARDCEVKARLTAMDQSRTTTKYMKYIVAISISRTIACNSMLFCC